MAYLRGDYYVWGDGKRLHLCARDGYGGWDEMERFDGECGVQNGRFFGPSGVTLPMNVTVRIRRLSGNTKNLADN